MLKIKNISKIVFIIILHLISISLYCNNISDTLKRDFKYKKYFSIEPQVYYPHYYIYSRALTNYDEQIKFKNKFNYGLGILISLRINKLKISSGIAYSSKNYLRNSNTVDKIKLYHIPVILTFICGNLNPFVGFEFNKPFYYNNLNNEKVKEEIVGSDSYSLTNSSAYYNKSISYKSGLSYTFKVNKENSIRLIIKIYSEYITYKKKYLQFDVYYSYVNSGSHNFVRPIAYDRFKVGVNISLEINLFNTKY